MRADALARIAAPQPRETWRGATFLDQRILCWRGDDGSVLFVLPGIDQPLTCTQGDWDAWAAAAGAEKVP